MSAEVGHLHPTLPHLGRQLAKAVVEEIDCDAEVERVVKDAESEFRWQADLI